MSGDSAQAHRFSPVLRQEERVTPLELFFDLVFVLAITQCTALMAAEPTWTGLAKGLAVLGVLWWAWVGYAWLTSVVDPEEGAVRIAIFAAMAALLVVALCVPEAFDDSALLFASAYGIVRFGQVVLLGLAGQDDPAMRKSVLGLAGSTSLGVGLLLAAALADGWAQGALWALALVLDIGGPLLIDSVGWKLVPGHFAERHGLIVIIAIGESIVAIGVGVVGGVDAGIVAAAVVGTAVAAALWWLYFDVVALVAQRRLAQAAPGREQNEIARDSYSYLHLPMVAGIVLVALGMKKTIGDVDDPLEARDGDGAARRDGSLPARACGFSPAQRAHAEQAATRNRRADGGADTGCRGDPGAGDRDARRARADGADRLRGGSLRQRARRHQGRRPRGAGRLDRIVVVSLRERCDLLRSLHDPGDPLLLPNAWDAASAAAVVEAGFPVVATTSSGVAAGLGYEDHQDAPAGEMFAAAARIARVVDVPVTVDAEAGYGLEPAELAAALERAGAAGCNLEDTDHAAESLRESNQHAAWLESVREAAGSGLVINARIDVFLAAEPGTAQAGLVSDALGRAHAYLDGGADCVYPIGLWEREALARFVAEAGGPVNVLAFPKAPPVGELAELGVARVSWGGLLHRGTMEQFRSTLDQLR